VRCCNINRSDMLGLLVSAQRIKKVCQDSEEVVCLN